MSANVSNFNNLLAYGISNEEKVLSIIQKKYPKAYRFEGMNKGFDIYVPEKDITIEVKGDEKSYYSGNFFFETQFKAPEAYVPRPSGINVTSCEYWVHFDKSYYYFIHRQSLQAYLSDWEAKEEIREIKKVGDDGTTIYGFLVPVERIQYASWVKVIKRT